MGSLISVIIPTRNAAPDIAACLMSLQAQTFLNFDVHIVDAASTDGTLDEVESYKGKVGKGISCWKEPDSAVYGAMNDGIARSRGEWLYFLGADDVVHDPEVFSDVAEILATDDADMVFGDVILRNAGKRYGGEFSLDRLLFKGNLCHQAVFYRRSLFERLGAYNLRYPIWADWDFNIRCFRLPDLRAHWLDRLIAVYNDQSGISREDDPVFKKELPLTLQREINRLKKKVRRLSKSPVGQLRKKLKSWRDGTDASSASQGVGLGPADLIAIDPRQQPLVSIIIPTCDGGDKLQACVESILSKTTYLEFELIVVDNQSTQDKTLSFLDSLQADNRGRVLKYDAPFNFSAINNFAARHAAGDILALVNDDIEVVSADWLTEMVPHALLSEVGAVGAKLLYPDGRIQHAGIVLGLDGTTVAGHAYKYADPESRVGQGALHVTRDCSAVTAACMVVRKALYQSTGGLDEKHLPVAYNDVDFCLRLLEKGYRNVWTPRAELIHHESVSRGRRDSLQKYIRHFLEVRYMRKRWKGRLSNDPHYSETSPSPPELP